jgi:lipopolysaccharide biosynthesis regulator YciM
VIGDLFQGAVALLLPVAAASGYFLARQGRGSKPVASRPAGRPITAPGTHPGGLLLGLHLGPGREREPEKVIDLLISLLEAEGDTTDTHLALAELYRRRGDVSRAIRLHQDLASTAAVPLAQRDRARLELGKDYLRSGLLDRAEEVFRTLSDLGIYPRQSLTELLDIYQQERDWDQALLCAERLEQVSGEPQGRIRAHLLCEKAGERLVRKDPAGAALLLQEALAADPACVRASLMAGDLALRAGNVDLALAHYHRVEGQDSDFLPEAIAPLLACHRIRRTLPEILPWLREIARRHQGATAVLALADSLREQGEEAEAIACLEEALRRRPSLRLLERLAEYRLAGPAVPAPGHEILIYLKDYAVRATEAQAPYRCISCGFAGRFLHWQCPGCKSWGRVKPVRGMEGE